MIKDLIAGTIAAAVIVMVAAAFLWSVPVRSAECGKITYYNATGNRTACGDVYTGREMIAAHRTLPCGTKLVVTDKATGKQVTVVVRDRGPAKWTGNSLDLSREAARQMGMIRRGKIYGCW